MNDMHRVTVETESTRVQCDVTEKRTRKPTFKRVPAITERLHREMSVNFKQASKLKTKITTLLASKENVCYSTKSKKILRQNASEHYNTLLTEFALPEEEQRKQEALTQNGLAIICLLKKYCDVLRGWELFSWSF